MKEYDLSLLATYSSKSASFTLDLPHKLHLSSTSKLQNFRYPHRGFLNTSSDAPVLKKKEELEGRQINTAETASIHGTAWTIG